MKEYRLPEKSVQRVRTIYTPDAANGLYKFNTTLQNCPPNVTSGCFTPPTNVTCTTGTSRLCTADLLAMATAAGITNTLDPTIKGLLAQIQSSVGTVNGVLTPVASNPNLQQFGFFNVGGPGWFYFRSVRSLHGSLSGHLDHQRSRWPPGPVGPQT